jgi:coniferyl-aldehyde dehydrogenase
MAAAGKNLVPVTLELGGKSPVIVGQSADIEIAARRVMYGKVMNAGQICLAPDYAFVPTDLVDQFVKELATAVDTMFPSGLADNDDYTSIVNRAHYDRLMSHIQDARSKGAEIIELCPAENQSLMSEQLKIAPKVITGLTDEMSIMQE